MRDGESTDGVRQIADHELVRCIGRGAYGEVWLGRNVTGAYRAVKIIYRKTFDGDRPFDREFDGIRKFEPISRTHPGFVSVLHVGRNDDLGCFYYVMELADDLRTRQAIQPETYVARNLAVELRQRGRFTPGECCGIGAELASALAHLHGHGLIHRDVKPSNIIFVNGHPKLADIGLVTEIGERATQVGTPGFIAPEGPGTPLADIYSLGKVLYQMAVGKGVDQYPALPTSLAEDADVLAFVGLNEVILKACEEHPRDRYQSAEEMRAALLGTTASGGLAGFSGVVSPGGLPSAPTPVHHRIALVYKGSAEPDGRLLRSLVQRLEAQGVQVFYDKHLAVGVEWARVIESKIRDADAVVVLLSTASVQSEMVAYEIELAHQAAEKHKGRPLLLPVRVQFNGALPDSFRPYLERLHYFMWEDPTDDERLVSELMRALETSQKSLGRRPQPKLESIGGAVPLDSQFYVVRPTDHSFQSAIARRDSIVLVKGARQMGKTSLLARGLQQARLSGARVVLTDFQKLSLSHLASAESFFVALGGFLADQLDLEVLPEDAWDKRRSPNTNFERYLRREVLGKMSMHLVWGLDEVDRLFSCAFGSEVFGLFRAWHNERALDPRGPWSHLTLAMAYATEAHLFITDVNQSPFNVGTRLSLEDFTFDQVADLNQRHGSPVKNEEEMRRFHELLAGQPYLVRRGLSEMASSKTSFANFAAHADRDEGIFGDHLRRMLVLLAKDRELSEVMRNALQGRPDSSPASFYRLRSSGLLKGDSPRQAELRCEIYAAYLKRHLL